jgi:polyisoprenyl-teichoic acid--peptidoglycan teichoic acid transferase
VNDPQRPPRLAWGMWKRFLLAGLIVAALSAITTATAGLLEVRDIASAISESGKKPALKVPELTAAEAGAPQTIMILGSDRRGKGARDYSPGYGNSDTMMLVHLDPNKNATALLSIPRDLKVVVPGHGVQKINAAYMEGGPRLAVRTVQEALPGVHINHVVDVRFKGFRAVVNRVGCVYADIDRRYFNDNALAYATINIKPGYQRLCGSDALDYVRFRHADTDLVRAARQQDFIRQAKDQVGVQKVISDRVEFARLFGKYADTDIRGTQQILRLFKLVAFSAGRPIREVHFRANLGPSYVTASTAQVDTTVNEFLNLDVSAAPRAPAPRPLRRGRGASLSALGLEAAKTSGEDQAIEAAPHLRFPVLFPRVISLGGAYVDTARAYVIQDLDHHSHQAYRMVLNKGGFGEYYGIQGMDWTGPPILDKPDESRTVNGRKLDLYFVGSRLRLVALRTKRAVYWVSNTLLLSLSNRQMLAIAGSLQRIGQ